MKLEAHGFDVDLVDGWEGRLFRRAAPSGDERTNPVLHLANFPLPEQRDDFGAGVVEHMRSGDVLVVVFDHGPDAARQPLFAAHGMPRLAAADFDRRKLQRAYSGQVGCQRFCNVGGRGICVYVVVGRASLSARLPEINAVLASVDVLPTTKEGE